MRWMLLLLLLVLVLLLLLHSDLMLLNHCRLSILLLLLLGGIHSLDDARTARRCVGYVYASGECDIYEANRTNLICF